MATKEKNTLKLVEQAVQEFFADLQVDASISVTKVDSEEEGAEVYSISLEGDDLGPLIGYHGDTLNALQLLLSLILTRKTGSWVRLSLNAGDWRERRGESLESMALRAADKALSTGSEVEMPPMSASDRRLVHLALKERPEVSSESSGDGAHRRVIIRPS